MPRPLPLRSWRLLMANRTRSAVPPGRRAPGQRDQGSGRVSQPGDRRGGGRGGETLHGYPAATRSRGEGGRGPGRRASWARSPACRRARAGRPWPRTCATSPGRLGRRARDRPGPGRDVLRHRAAQRARQVRPVGDRRDEPGPLVERDRGRTRPAGIAGPYCRAAAALVASVCDDDAFQRYLRARAPGRGHVTVKTSGPPVPTHPTAAKRDGCGELAHERQPLMYILIAVILLALVVFALAGGYRILKAAHTRPAASAGDHPPAGSLTAIIPWRPLPRHARKDRPELRRRDHQAAGPDGRAGRPGHDADRPRPQERTAAHQSGRPVGARRHLLADSHALRRRKLGAQPARRRRGHADPGRRRLEFTAAELPQEEAGAALMRIAGPRLAKPLGGLVLRQTIGLAPYAPLADFTGAAADHPVFRLTFRTVAETTGALQPSQRPA